MYLSKYAAGILAFFVPVIAAFAQTVPYHNLRFEEDWSNFSSDDAADWSDGLKNIEIGDNTSLSIGGSARVRYESWDNFGFGDANDDDFTLFRAYLHTDWRIGDRWRVFVQGRASTVNNRDLPGGKRAGLDIDEFDLWNTFVEAKLSDGDLAASVRLGRQELQYGAQRLISPLDWSNNRRIFDGAVLKLKSSTGWKMDAFVTAPVMVSPEEFHWNDTDHNRLFSGVYYQHAFNEGKRNMDAYLLGLNHINDAAVENDRYTLGGRYYGALSPSTKFDTEFALQFGETEYNAGQTTPGGAMRGDEDILAWMLTAEVTHTAIDKDWKPWVTVGFDVASGDDDPEDGDNNTFSHLFPLAHAYLGFSDVVGRQNVIDVRATVGAWPIPGKLRVRADVHYLQLYDDNDGLYGAAGTLSRSAYVSDGMGGFIHADENDLGVAIDLTGLYKVNRHMAVLLGYSHFAAGDFIEATGSDDDIHFVYGQVNYKF